MDRHQSVSVVEQLVRDVRSRSSADDVAALRQSFAQLLEGLDVAAATPAWRDGIDVIGSAYIELLASGHRRSYGQVYTPMWAAGVMSGWAVPSSEGLVLDPGCGSGVLLMAAAQAQRKPCARFLGLDIDPLAVLMTDVNVRLRQIQDVETRVSNFLLEPIDERPTAIVCNPPFTRHHALTRSDKEAIAASLGNRLSLKLTRQASLHALFLARALEVAADVSRIAFITPAQWLDTDYGREVKQLLMDTAHVAAVIELDPKFFPNARTSAAITLIEKNGFTRTPTAVLRVTNPLPEPQEVLREIANPGKQSSGAITNIPRRSPRRRGVGASLGELAYVHRGIATGCNGFFVLSDDNRREWGLSHSYLRPCTTSPRYVVGHVLTDEALLALPSNVPRWLLVARRAQVRGPLANYLAYGRDLGADARHLSQERRPWFAIRWRGTFPILFSYFNTTNARFVRNVAGALPLNTWLALEPREGVHPDELFELLSNERVLEGVPEGARQYGDGLWKLEPSELQKLWIPNARPSAR